MAYALTTTLRAGFGGPIHTRLVRIPLALCLAIGLAACGDKEAAPEQPEVVAVTPFPGAPTDVQRSEASVWDEEPSLILKNEEPVQITEYQVVSEKQIRVFFETGSDGCYGAKYELKETPDAIEIKVVEGNYLTTTFCTAEATFQSMLIDLKEPIGNREIRPLSN